MKSALILFFEAIVFCVPSFSQESAKDAKIEKLLTSMNIDKQVDIMFTQMRSAIASQMPKGTTEEQRAKINQVQGKVLDLMQARLSWEKMRPQYVKLYSDTFTGQEIDGIAAFYESPAGKALLEKMPTLLSKSMAIGQDVLRDIMPQIQQMVKDAADSKPTPK